MLHSSSRRPAPAPHRAAAPPTPAVPLSTLLDRTDLGLRQVAGPRGAPDAVVHWVHTSEMADPVPYLLGGELLLTAGVHFDPTVAADAGPGTYLDGYVRRSLAAGAAALGFGVLPVHDAVPAALLDACDRHGLPLLEVPPDTPFTAVESAVWQAVTEARHRELTRLSEAQRALSAAAARPDPAPAVLRALSRHTGGWTALLAPGGGELATAGPAPDPACRAAAVRLVRIVTPDEHDERSTLPTWHLTPSSATDTLADGTHLAVYALTGPASGDSPVPRAAPAPVLAVASRPYDATAHTVTGVAAVLLSLITGQGGGPGDTAAAGTLAGQRAALTRVLLGASPSDAAPLLTSARWTVVHAQRRRDSDASVEALATALGTSLIDPGPPPDPSSPCPVVRALVPGDAARLAATPGWTLGAGEPVPVADLPVADRHAATALRRALARRAPLARHRVTGPHSVSALVAPPDAEAHAREHLGPLLDSPDLLATLRAWISQHGSWDRTATALAVHRNTVRQRITRITRLLETDLDDADVRMELWFALKALDAPR
ncbi:PucR family transcriptional regulator [Streptomyces sp. NPDC007100]|uniref:PucR family transcriptional regulator n=1 Tax=Streptomyces sp. NPDC007100 TaxID=3155602 RepID=UPI0033F63873